MNYGRALLAAFALFGVILPCATIQAALNLEGQSGIFLNSLAYTVPSGKYEVSSHYVNLDNLGTVSTFNFSTGLKGDVEFGFTKVTSSVSGVNDQNVFLAKWQAVKEKPKAPAVALWGIHRALDGSSSSSDFGLSATKLINVAKRPAVIDLGVRSTKALGLGLFGFGDDRKLKLEGSAAVFVTPKFAVGAEFKQQIGSATWKDIAFRYIASDRLNIDAGIADLGPSLDNQVALAATFTW